MWVAGPAGVEPATTGYLLRGKSLTRDFLVLYRCSTSLGSLYGDLAKLRAHGLAMPDSSILDNFLVDVAIVERFASMVQSRILNIVRVVQPRLQEVTSESK